MNKVILCTLFAVVAASGNLFSDVTIDNFDSYTTSAELQTYWNSFGAASAGLPALNVGGGVGGTNAARYGLVWSAGNNANMRMFNVPSGVQDLSAATSVEVTLYIVTRDGFSAPTDPTALKLVIQGGANDSIWQTTDAAAVSLSNTSYSTVGFTLNTTDMERVGGSDSLTDTLAAITSIRLRFENAVESNVIQDAYIDSIVAVTVPEAEHYASFAAIGVLLITMVYRRRGCRQG
ncbi:MAG: hypothetical protein Q7Q73_19280 [Verrucomicrobiota bacterium JB024]|nr:hypothetical protein [Verrucomicrobiota bacterium JB024]